MKTPLLFALGLLPLAPLTAEAASYRCQTKGFCTNNVSCKPDDAYLEARDLPGGKMRFGWEESDARFVGDPIVKDQMVVYVASQNPGSIQAFTLADNLQGTMSVISVFGDDLYHSIQALTCVETSR